MHLLFQMYPKCIAHVVKKQMHSHSSKLNKAFPAVKYFIRQKLLRLKDPYKV